MQDSVRTAGRLTVMMPIVQVAKPVVRLSDLTEELGRQLVHNILVRKGNTYLMNKTGTRFKPLAQLIYSRAMLRLASNESPDAIVRDLEAQLLLIKGTP